METPMKVQLKENFMALKNYATKHNETSVLAHLESIGQQLGLDTVARYSDVVPYENRKYWYFTLHGLGAGTLPKGVNVLETREGQNDKGSWGDYICLDAVLNTSELKEFDVRELAPPEEEKEEYDYDYLSHG